MLTTMSELRFIFAARQAMKARSRFGAWVCAQIWAFDRAKLVWFIYVFFLKNNYILIPSHSDSFLFHFEYNFCQERVDLRQDTWWRAKTRTYSKVVNINPSYPQLLYHRLSKAPSFLDRKLTQRKRRSGTCIGLVAIFLLEVQNVLYRHMSSCVHYTHTHMCVYNIYTYNHIHIYK